MVHAANDRRFMPVVALTVLPAAVMVAAGGGCGSGDTTGGASDPGMVTGSGTEEVPKIFLGRAAGDIGRDAASLDVESMQPDLVQPRASHGSGIHEAGYEWLDGASVGGTRTLGHYAGRPLVVNFFESRCPPCVREMSEFQSVFTTFGGDVAFLGLSQDPTVEDALELVEATGVTYDIGWDPDLEVYKLTGSLAMPTTAFITADGELAEVFAGALDRDGLLARIASITGS